MTSKNHQSIMRNNKNSTLHFFLTVLFWLPLNVQSFQVSTSSSSIISSQATTLVNGHTAAHKQHYLLQSTATVARRAANPAGTTARPINNSNSALAMSESESESSPSFDKSSIYVMVNGMPGPMATAAAEACLRKGLKLAPFAMTGPQMEQATITIVDDITGTSSNVLLIPSSNQDEIVSQLAGLREAEMSLLAIDYTHPSAVNTNAKFYVQQKIPFVMGTTGGDREQLNKDVTDGQLSCVIAPNMGKQIVAMQAALEDLASKYPAAFAGYTLDVLESHQKTKADTSGTAKAVISSIQTLVGDGCEFQTGAGSEDEDKNDIQMIRDDDQAIAFGVPETALTGHAFHTYTLTSPDKSVQFQLKHNVAGRTIYAEGTADAVQFLAKKLTTQTEPTVYNMINVLEEGALE
mmetsp:Transcript_1565/g.2214  ORF Transcript_1565/g.2214 Transcript_1565/m.2214 type:complete len:407 (+) Transcript_1565:195-1415(+)|eukprot:CAMPEP_0198145906 /NCGR_PEP_ID=MMETSP1443-20131203/26064_1 /TAXON_ID=186043 /ORGANISM="Entomoneis sp., Strain CCMP2396" /LENGTH=406 /DNA_ID=CAMNT_0043809667 /DNA_START=131 /DNA_END=1351 /DNA_ORIENTATION=-